MAAFVSFILTGFWLVLIISPVNSISKESFLSYLRTQLNKIKTIKCPNNAKEASWNQYCDPIDSSVLTCPSIDAAPSRDFYNNRCILSYIYQKMASSPEAAFSSLQSTQLTLNELFQHLPKERCGDDESYYCQRDISVCYRETTDQSTCLSISEVCHTSTHKELCSTTGRVFLLQHQLQKFLDRETATTLRAHNSTMATEEPTNASKETVWIVTLLSLVVGGFTLLALCMIITKKRQKSKERKAQDPDPLLRVPLADSKHSSVQSTTHSSSPKFSPSSAFLREDNEQNRSASNTDDTKHSKIQAHV